MSTETVADRTPADLEAAKAHPSRAANNKAYRSQRESQLHFQIDAGTKPDGSRDRRRYTYTKLAEAKPEYARIMTEAATGTLVRRDKVTSGDFLTEWLDSRRVRPNTLDGYLAAPKPVIDHLGTMPLQHLDTPHLDELVALRLTGEPIPQRAKRGHRSAEVLAYLRARPAGGALFGAADHVRRARHKSTLLSGVVRRCPAPAARPIHRRTGRSNGAPESIWRRE